MMYVCEKKQMDVLRFLVEECKVSVKNLDLMDPRLNGDWNLLLYLLDHEANTFGLSLMQAVNSSQFAVARHMMKTDRELGFDFKKKKTNEQLEFAHWWLIVESGSNLKEWAVRSVSLKREQDIIELVKVANDQYWSSALDGVAITWDLRELDRKSLLEVAELVKDKFVSDSLKKCKISVNLDEFEGLCAHDLAMRPLLEACESIGLTVNVRRRDLSHLLNDSLIRDLKRVNVVTDENLGLKYDATVSDLIDSLAKEFSSEEPFSSRRKNRLDFRGRIDKLVLSAVDKKEKGSSIDGFEFDPDTPVRANNNNDDAPKLSPLVKRKFFEDTTPVVLEGTNPDVVRKRDLDETEKRLLSELTHVKEYFHDLEERLMKKVDLTVKALKMNNEGEFKLTAQHLYFFMAALAVIAAVAVTPLIFPILKNDVALSVPLFKAQDTPMFDSNTLFGIKTDQGWLCPSSEAGLFLSHASCLFSIEQSGAKASFVLSSNGKFISTSCFENNLCLNHDVKLAAKFKIDPLNRTLLIGLADGGWKDLMLPGKPATDACKLRVVELFSYSDALDWPAFEELSTFVQQIYPASAAYSAKRGSIGLSWREVKEKFWRVIEDGDVDSVIDFGIALVKCPIAFVRLENKTYVAAESSEVIANCNIKAKIESWSIDLISWLGIHSLAALQEQRRHKEL